MKLSEDDKARIRKHNQSSIDSDSTMDSDSSADGAQAKKPRWVKLPDNDKSCSCKRKHYPDSSDEEPEYKIQRRGNFVKCLVQREIQNVYAFQIRVMKNLGKRCVDLQ